MPAKISWPPARISFWADSIVLWLLKSALIAVLKPLPIFSKPPASLFWMERPSSLFSLRALSFGAAFSVRASWSRKTPRTSSSFFAWLMRCWYSASRFGWNPASFNAPAMEIKSDCCGLPQAASAAMLPIISRKRLIVRVIWERILFCMMISFSVRIRRGVIVTEGWKKYRPSERGFSDGLLSVCPLMFNVWPIRLRRGRNVRRR